MGKPLCLSERLVFIMTPMQQSRLDKAKLIIDRPADFKVCEACGSIVSETTAACPNCNAYRFDANPDYVVEQAVLLASREQRSVTPEDLEKLGLSPPGLPSGPPFRLSSFFRSLPFRGRLLFHLSVQERQTVSICGGLQCAG